jgi:NADH-quinone oxidoreductase subunit L
MMLATSTWMLDHAWLVPLLPALSFVVILLFGKRMPRKGSEVGIAAVGAAFLMGCWCAFEWIQRIGNATGTSGSAAVKAFGRSAISSATATTHEPLVKPILHGFTWWQNAGIKFDFGIQVDGLAVMMFFVVGLISLLVHIYSTAYMKDDVRYTHFFAALSLFTASILLLVVSDNILGMLLGWEGTSVCSFMLIGHWWEDHANSSAALKAFFTTRTGDIGLLIGIVMCYWFAGSFNIIAINQAALSGTVSHTVLLVTACALFLAVMGKSGQFPLHTWLPDAMAGPTPVSALIHAATMVVAGVYLVARLYPVFWQGFSISSGGVNAMALIGGITILAGAALAFVQDDIKKVLAYSTISQLGYMIMGLGVGAWSAAVFHLFTHAFFKACLFLGAGSVSHSGSHHSFDMKKDMGGLKKYMPITFWTFVIATLALAGIFPLAGFWSKDEILATSHFAGYNFFLIVGLIGAFMTAAYMMRCVYLTFLGEERGHHHPHESEKAITVPLVILAFFAVFAGFLNASAFNIEKFKEWVEPRTTSAFQVFPLNVIHPEFNSTAGILAVISVAIALSGIGIAYLFYSGRLKPLENLTERNALARAGKGFLVNKYYLDYLYTDVIVASIKGPIAKMAYWVNQNVIDAVVRGAGVVARSTAGFTYSFIDRKVVDGSITEIATATGASGGLLRKVQSGRVQRYALLIFIAVGLFALAIFLSN